MKRGFSFFQTSDSKKDLELERLEAAYNFKFPPLFRLFANSFELGDEKLQVEKYLNENGNLAMLGCIIYPSALYDEPIILNDPMS